MSHPTRVTNQEAAQILWAAKAWAWRTLEQLENPSPQRQAELKQAKQFLETVVTKATK